MSDGFDSAWIKFGRATTHAVAMKDEAIKFLKAHPEPTFAARFVGEVEVGSEGGVSFPIYDDETKFANALERALRGSP